MGGPDVISARMRCWSRTERETPHLPLVESFTVMASTSSPFGIRAVSHPSGILRQEVFPNGIASGYGTAIYTGTPVKRTTDGTLVVVGTGADVCIGVFQGVEYTNSSGGFTVSPYWPASATYAADGRMEAYCTTDKEITYEGQTDATVAATVIGESINLATASTGSASTGLSAQMLTATTTGATAGTFQVLGLAPYPNNAWGDSYVIVRVKISSYQGVIA